MAMRSAQLEAGIAKRGHGQIRVSNRVGSPCSARDRVLRVVCAARPPRVPRGNEKRGPRSEACHASVWLRFGAATLARRRALRERMP